MPHNTFVVDRTILPQSEALHLFICLCGLLVGHMLGNAEAKETHYGRAQEYQDDPSLEGAETSGVRAAHC